ncbi:MAG: amidohydrolase family protein [Janthinobacterium lividum]
MHVYSDRYPTAASATLAPPDASLTQYRGLQRRLGTTRNVFVLPSTYGSDNASVLDAVAASGAVARGIGAADGATSPAELAKWDRLGIVGVRFNLVRAGMSALADAQRLASFVATLGWHLEFHVLGVTLPELAPFMTRLPCDVAIDHMGRMTSENGIAAPAFDALRRLLDGGRCWVKLSGTYLDANASEQTRKECGKALVAHRPDRMVWGSDWPHPAAPQLPDDAALLDQLVDWAPDVETRRRILVDNAARLYRF